MKNTLTENKIIKLFVFQNERLRPFKAKVSKTEKKKQNNFHTRPKKC